MEEKSLTTTPAMVTAYKLREDEMCEALAGRIPKELFSSVVLTMFRKTPRILECTKDSVLPALYEIAAMGLVPGLGQAYLVPFKNNRRGKYEATLIVGYQGYVELAWKAAKVRIRSMVVREGDYWEWSEGLEPRIDHTPNSSNGDRLLAVYAVADGPNGAKWHDVMTAGDVDAVRKRSRAKNDGPWMTDEEEMWKKTVTRRLFKMLPKSPEMAKVQELDDVETMDADFQVIPDEAPEEPKKLSQEEQDLKDELFLDGSDKSKPKEKTRQQKAAVTRAANKKAKEKAEEWAVSKVKMELSNALSSKEKSDNSEESSSQASPAEESAPSQTSAPAGGGAGPSTLYEKMAPLSKENEKEIVAIAEDFGMNDEKLDHIAKKEFQAEAWADIYEVDFQLFKDRVMTVGEIGTTS